MTKEARILRIISSVIFVLLVIASVVTFFHAYGVGSVVPLNFIAKVFASMIWLSIAILFLALGFKETFNEETNLIRALFSLFAGIVAITSGAVIMWAEALYIADYQLFGFPVVWIIFSAVYGKYLAIRPSAQMRYLASLSKG